MYINQVCVVLVCFFLLLIQRHVTSSYNSNDSNDNCGFISNSHLFCLTISQTYSAKLFPGAAGGLIAVFLPPPSVQVSVPSSIQLCKVIRGCCSSVQEA